VSRVFTKASRQSLAAALAIVLLAAAMPLGAGVALISTPHDVQLSLDLCHPLQAFSAVQSVPMARPSASLAEFLLQDFGVASDLSSSMILRLDSPPENPPPESAA
jgi:hypothetical protein